MHASHPPLVRQIGKLIMKTSPLAFAAVLGASTAPVFSQPGTASQPDIWALLGGIQVEEIVTETSYEVRKSWPKGFDAELREIEVSGFAVPMIPGQTVQELLLASDSGFCPLCGSPDHGASLQVSLTSPVPEFEDGQRISVRGTLVRIEDSTTWQAARLIDAQIIVQ